MNFEVIDAMARQRRVYKIAEQIRSTIATRLLRLSDPRINMITVTSVHLSGDLRLAKIYWTATDGKKRIDEIEDGLASATGVLKRAIGSELKMKFVPELRFYYDDTLDLQEETVKLLKKVGVLKE
ncbi:MAG: 30S ribosome-binding factor RbfA [Candidatus Dadabacteria bacterium]|nr:MAG: 30S ribosome-binding factor RbfA [Candidatus Dadabacteria bacterium]